MRTPKKSKKSKDSKEPTQVEVESKPKKIKNLESAPQATQESQKVQEGAKKGEVIKEPKLHQVAEAEREGVKESVDSTPPPEPKHKENLKTPVRAAMPQGKTGTITQSLAESEAIKEVAKGSKEDKESKAKPRAKIQSVEKVADSKISEPATPAQATQAGELIESEEPRSFEELFTQSKEKAKGKTSESEEGKESKKTQAHKQHAEVSQSSQSSRTQILYRSAQARESMRNFAQQLREEVQNYKPPVTKLSLELNPQNLGTLELTLTKKGKDLHIQVVSNPTAVGLFLQNQVDFKHNLAQVGFDNVNLSFTTSDGGSGGNGAQERQEANPQQERNENSLEESKEAEVSVMNITLPKYA